ncbi:hypothetical protein K1T71_007126 [Dendrolimus kikuchii]|uniref:Uncharacterized protein n=1 Tax=Dendrolimus kikuchii TaxID=765133 RepID=A0ACC1D0R3_9NEOP|nr:hypothetical protein K1T71_007126 [Dendrolimus kikuchii]
MRRVKVSIAQQNHLIKFMKAHPEFAKVRTCSLQGKIDYERQWLQLTRTLNSLGGPIKSVDKWKQTWRDLRYGVKRKANKQKPEDDQDNSRNETDPSESFINVIAVLLDIERERLRIQKKELLRYVRIEECGRKRHIVPTPSNWDMVKEKRDSPIPPALVLVTVGKCVLFIA